MDSCKGLCWGWPGVAPGRRAGQVGFRETVATFTFRSYYVGTDTYSNNYSKTSVHTYVYAYIYMLYTSCIYTSYIITLLKPSGVHVLVNDVLLEDELAMLVGVVEVCEGAVDSSFDSVVLSFADESSSLLCF